MKKSSPVINLIDNYFKIYGYKHAWTFLRRLLEQSKSDFRYNGHLFSQEEMKELVEAVDKRRRPLLTINIDEQFSTPANKTNIPQRDVRDTFVDYERAPKPISKQPRLKANWRQFQTIVKRNNINQLYHFTDKSNIQSITEHGGLFSWYALQRKGIRVPRPGGNEISRQNDINKGLKNYVRLCFHADQPMKHIAQGDGRMPNPVILKIEPEVIYFYETKYSNMNACHNNCKVGYMYRHFQNIRFDILNKQRWENEIEKGVWQSEVLVLEHIPLKYITNINSLCNNYMDSDLDLPY